MRNRSVLANVFILIAPRIPPAQGDWLSNAACESARAIERPSNRAIERPSDRPSDRAIERPSDRATERPSDLATEHPSDRPIERSSDRPRKIGEGLTTFRGYGKPRPFRHPNLGLWKASMAHTPRIWKASSIQAPKSGAMESLVGQTPSGNKKNMVSLNVRRKLGGTFVKILRVLQ